jgi:hypothetical protein
MLCVLKERSPLAPDLKGLESGVREPSCKEYAVSVDMSCWEGPDGQGHKPMTREAPGSRVTRSAPVSSSFQMGSPSSLAKSGGIIHDTGCVVPRPFWLLEGTKHTQMFGSVIAII